MSETPESTAGNPLIDASIDLARDSIIREASRFFVAPIERSAAINRE